ncbi:hypothetical protein M436DRAFT_45339 [Aureobasidium namibiae CBS 147.97]|uniref:Uncharacterized protein n=1 Tax=Aureobasidium namibiae CBS 147.97 TaxID=1043004 RepID=A0A074WLY5_9PEZI|nr:uncharacterized protein M436DRAFT_45339 [Aureobasidium namibiae CBS 147.97]KEQ74128.1 hypothetical protein M436DRAFT_45339 [Aureobasidium namibiae CBS 147.97]
MAVVKAPRAHPTTTAPPSSSGRGRSLRLISEGFSIDIDGIDHEANTHLWTPNEHHIFRLSTDHTSIEAVHFLLCSTRDFCHLISPAKMASHKSLLRDSFDGFLELITTVFLDSIVFFLTLGFCILAPRLFIRITNRFARWNVSTEDQKGFWVFSAIVLTAVHSLLTLLLALDDDTGVTPNAPSVFWAIMWSTGIIVGVLGGFLAATVVALCGIQMIGL